VYEDKIITIIRYLIIRYSAIGPRARAGKKLRAPTIMITTISQIVKSGVWVGRVPGLDGIIFLRASDPAIANTGIAVQ
jgi:hypothetical protein